MSESNSVEWLAKQLAGQNERIKKLETKPNLAYSSVDGGALIVKDGEGNVSSVIGLQDDGTYTASSINGPIPPTPSLPIVEDGIGNITVTWDGGFENSDLYVPMDFANMEIHVSDNEEFTFEMGNYIGVISSDAGGSKTFNRPEGVWYVHLVTKSQSGRRSEPSGTMAGISSAPINADLRAPSAPLGVTATALLDFDPKGTARGRVVLTWQPVTTASDGTEMDVVQYNVWGQTGAGEYTIVQSVETTNTTVYIPSGAIWNFKVQALGNTSTKPGQLSPPVTVTAPTDQTPPPVPNAPQLSTWLRTVTVKWNGGPAMPVDFSHINVYQNNVKVATMSADGVYQTGVMPANVPISYTLSAVDFSGNESAKSTAASVTPVANVDISQITAEIDAAAVKITNAKEILVETNKTLDATLTESFGTAKTETTTAISNAKIEAAQDAQERADQAVEDAKVLVNQVIAKGQSLVRNGDFEAGMIGWAGGAGTRAVDTLYARSGASAMKLTPTTSNSYTESEYIPTSGGRVYYMEAWMRRQVGTPGTGNVGFVVRRTLASGTTSVSVVTGIPMADVSDSVWTKVSATYTAPATDTISIRFGPWAGISPVAVWVDDIIVMDVTEAQAAINAAKLANDEAIAAQGAAGAASGVASNALTMAGTATKAYYSTEPATGVARTDRDIWRQVDAAKNVIAEWYWNGTPPAGGWVKTLVSSQAISNLDVGKLTVGTAVMTNAIVDHLFAKVVEAKMVTANEFIGENAIMTNSITAPKIVASEEMWAKVLGAHKINADEINTNSLTTDTAFVGELWAAGLNVGVPATNLKSGTLPSGTTINTKTGLSRVAISPVGIKAYDSAGAETVAINSDGSAFFKGTIQVGSTIPTSVIPTLSETKISGLEAKLDSAAATTTTLGEWTYPGTTLIDGGNIRTGTISATQINATAINGKTITGAVIKTRSDAASGANPKRGIEVNGLGANNYLRAYNAVGATTFDLNGNTGDALITGVFQTAPTGRRLVLSDKQTPEHTTAAIDIYANSGTEHGSVYTTFVNVHNTVLRHYIDDDGNWSYNHAITANGAYLLGGGVSQADEKRYYRALGDLFYMEVSYAREYTLEPNMHITSNGIVGRSTSKRANKLALQPLPESYDDKILSLQAHTWFDRQESEDVAENEHRKYKGKPLRDSEGNKIHPTPDKLRRIPGMVAEEVAEAGLPEFVTHGKNGEIEGLMYERLGVALIPVVKRQRDRIDELESKVSDQEARLADLEAKMKVLLNKTK